MIDGKYCIAVMSIGSSVGQSVISSCNLSRLPITTIGLGNNPMAFGAYECDYMDYVPMIYEDDYIDELIKKCTFYHVDIIIPGFDDEAYILSKHKRLLEDHGFKVLVSEVSLFRVVNDKALMCDELSSIADIFVKSYTLADVQMKLKRNEVNFPLIAKPRDSYASKGIEILLCENDFIKVTDDHIIQELAIPHEGDPFRSIYMQQIQEKNNLQVSEVSIQVVTGKNGDILGKMASFNKLNNGIPIEIMPYENDCIWSEIDKLLPALRELGHRGPLNIQGRLTDKGLKLFEMNARFTGITGLRAIMGFNEVESCIKDWLDINTSKDTLQLNYDRFGIRQTMPRILSLDNNKRMQDLSVLINKKKLKSTKAILVTGASGYLGQTITRLLAESDYRIMALGRNKSKLMALYNRYDHVTCYDQNDLNDGVLRFGLVDCIIHCAFARAYRGNRELADSLKFTREIFDLATVHQVPKIINISSQAVYGSCRPLFWHETTEPIPETNYAVGKYSTELMANTIKSINKHSHVTSLRLASLAGGQSGSVPTDILYKFVKSSLNHETIKIIDGSQKINRLDVRDVAEGVVRLLEMDSSTWESVYNFGPIRSYTLLEVVELVSLLSKNYEIDTTFERNKEKAQSYFRMDSSKLYALLNWKPRYSLEETLLSLFDYIQ